MTGPVNAGGSFAVTQEHRTVADSKSRRAVPGIPEAVAPDWDPAGSHTVAEGTAGSNTVAEADSGRCSQDTEHPHWGTAVVESPPVPEANTAVARAVPFDAARRTADRVCQEIHDLGPSLSSHHCEFQCD